jgi:hypothetical protein
VDVVPRQSVRLRQRQAVHQIPDAVVHQIRGARQIQGVLRGLPVRLGHQDPSACELGASDAVHRHTGRGRRRGHWGRRVYVADSFQVHSWDGDQKSACHAEFQRPGPDCPYPVQSEVESEPCKRAVGRSAASPFCEQAEPAAWGRLGLLLGLIQLKWLEWRPQALPFLLELRELQAPQQPVLL